MNRNDYHHIIQECRALDNGADEKKTIVGKAICFDEPTKLFSSCGNDYFEIITIDALDATDMSDVFLKYNHGDAIPVLARTRNGSLRLDKRDDGLYIEADMPDTTAGNDMYELIRSGVLDKMSFGFTIGEESFNEDTRTWTVRSIKKLYEVSAVPNPAYEGTSLHSRRANEVESRLAELENLIKRRIAESIYIMTLKKK